MLDLLRGHGMLDLLNGNDSEMETYWVLGTGRQASPGAFVDFFFEQRECLTMNNIDLH